MQPLHFTQISSKKHKAVRRWFYINCSLIAVLIMVCSLLSVKKRNSYVSTQKIISTMVNPTMSLSLKVIAESLEAKAQLESFSLSDHQVEFKIASTDTDTITTIAQLLEQSHLNIQLVGLENHMNNKKIGVFTQKL